MWTGIELLYPLQEMRLGFPFLEDLFMILSSRIFYLALPVCIAFAFYWFIDKKKGEILCLSFLSAFLFTTVSKYGFDQPRPWDLDSDIIKVEGVHANGKSLPSGHTAAMVSTVIPAAIFGRKKILGMALIILAIMVIVGRLILCVHTPLDIIAGLAVGICALMLAWGSMEFAYDDDRRYHLINAVYTGMFTILFAVGVIVWGVRIEIAIGYAGFFYGMIVGRTLDRIYLHWEPMDLGVMKDVMIFLLGMGLGGVVLIVMMYFVPAVGAGIGGAFLMIWCFFLYPKILQDHGVFEQ